MSKDPNPTPVESIGVADDAPRKLNGHEFIAVTVGQYSLFFTYGRDGFDALLLYLHLIYSARRQRTNQVRATDGYLRKGLRWGQGKVEKAKAMLKKLDLIDYVRRSPSKGQPHYGETYIRLKHLHKRVTLESGLSTPIKSIGVEELLRELTEPQLLWFTKELQNNSGCAKGEILKVRNPNALSEEGNALSEKNAVAGIPEETPKENAGGEKKEEVVTRMPRKLLKVAGKARTPLATANLPQDEILYEEIVEHLNKAAGKSYRADTSTTRRLIKARWKQGYRLEDFKHVIDVKVAEWKGTKWEVYLRPETLFADDHFESYRNQSKVLREHSPFGETLRCPHCYNLVYPGDTLCRTCGKPL